MLNGVRPKICERCFREEDSNIKSARQKSNLKYKDSIQQYCSESNTSDIKYLDLRLGNHCNLQCIMCNPCSSNSWIKDWNKLNPKNQISQQERETLSNINWQESIENWSKTSANLSGLQELYLTGGEPLLIDAHIDLLNSFIDGKISHSIDLKYNTNCTIYPEKNISLWRQFKSVTFNLSIDANGKLNDYIRYPSKWTNVQNNLLSFIKLSKEEQRIKVQVHITVQALNIAALANLLDDLTSYGIVLDQIFFNILNHPNYLNTRVLSTIEKDKASKKLRLYSNRSPDFEKKIEELISYMEKEDWSHLRPELISYIDRIDKVRDIKLRDIYDFIK